MDICSYCHKINWFGIGMHKECEIKSKEKENDFLLDLSNEHKDKNEKDNEFRKNNSPYNKIKINPISNVKNNLIVHLTAIENLPIKNRKNRKKLIENKEVQNLSIRYDENNKYDDKAIAVFLDKYYGFSNIGIFLELSDNEKCIGYISKYEMNETINNFCFYDEVVNNNTKQKRNINRRRQINSGTTRTIQNVNLKWDGSNFILYKETKEEENFRFCQTTKDKDITDPSKITVYPDEVGDVMYDVMSHVRFEQRRFLDQYNIYYLYFCIPINELKSILEHGISPYNKKCEIVDPINKLTVDTYIPFYFNFKSALFNMKQKDNINDIIILAIDRDFIFYKNTIYTNGDPFSSDTKFYNDYEDLNKLSWDSINNPSDRGNTQETSTILIPDRVWSNDIYKIYCNSYILKKDIDKIIKNYVNIETIVEAKEIWPRKDKINSIPTNPSIIKKANKSNKSKNNLILQLAEICNDYRLDEGLNPTPEIIKKWITQFSLDNQETILSEMIYIFNKMYISKINVEEFLTELISNEKLVGNDPESFWENVSLLDIQEDGESQDIMVQTIRDFIFGEYIVEVAINDYSKTHFIYLDDILFSGKKLQTDLINFMKKAPKNAKLDVFYMGYHSTGKYYVSEKWLKDNNSKKINMKIWDTMELENRKACHNVSDTLVPTESIMDLPKIQKYLDEQPGNYYLRDPDDGTMRYCKGNSIFSSEENRQILEKEFTLAGLKINATIRDAGKRKFWRPLGLTSFSGLGFGAMIVTYRNCPNNTPLALWWGDWEDNNTWTPLFLRKTYNRGSDA